MIGIPRALWLVIGVALAACRGEPVATEACTCTPANRAMNGSGIDGGAVIAKLRRHRRDVEAHRTPRDIKVQDDQLRFEVLGYCQPCGDWVKDRTTIEELYPLERLDEAVDVVCMGLVLRDGSTAWGAARPVGCR